MLENKDYAMDYVNDFYFEKLDFCGCGIPKDVIIMIKDILNIISTRDTRSYEEQQELFRECFKLKKDSNDMEYTLLQFILNVLDNADVTEHGSSIGNSYLTIYGKKLLECLNALTVDEIDDALSR